MSMAIKKAVDGDDQEKKGSEAVPYYKLFSYADQYDILMMLIGTVSSIIALKTVYLGIAVGIATFIRK
ncbi:hypothetical protein C5167_017927 [Papaver somniferum]|uniref:Uncharacterized protein n=1 Tax=Papaver somniferum TaxID=3469 RepID=A0A4Y7IP49_PAPSO|nr:hypothetical protein C5167_017927 [Papaver somniferum]